MTTPRNDWKKSSWKNYPALQQPKWPDQEVYQKAVDEIAAMPPLVFAGEVRSLKALLADAVEGKAFLLQGGDCAEDFAMCTYAGGKPVIKVGRIAGQYAKPRSSDTEKIGNLEIPSYRGDMVNSPEPTQESRIPNPRRMVEGYYKAAATMNLLRAFTRGGYAALHRVHAWNQEFVKNSPMGRSYERLAKHISQALNFMEVIGIDTDIPQLNQATFFTSHEALLLGYEEALTRQDSTTGDWYDCSGHMLWIGDRTRQLDGAHVEFFRGVHNPVGMKIGPKHDIDEIKKIIDRLNPDNEPGKLTLITRFGTKQIEKYLPNLIRAIRQEGYRVVWSCDPMHGNTYTAASGHKTRNFNEILQEIQCFFEIHWAEGSVPGGVHFELTGDNVTECTGGDRNILDEQLQLKYQTNCDPRLNAEQSLELAFHIAEMIKS